MQTNGGTIAPGKEIKSYTGGKSLTLPGAADITRGGYTFEGWYEDSGFSGSPVTKSAVPIQEIRSFMRNGSKIQCR